MEPNPNVALICGGLSGTPRAVAVELLRRGWSVLVQDTDTQANAAVTELVQQTQTVDRLTVFCGDVATEDQREALVEFALEQLGRLDLLVSAPLAGRAVTSGDLLELDPATALGALSAGAVTTLFLAQRVANEMIRLIETGATDGGKIVLLGSLAAYTTSVDQALACLNATAVATVNRLFADRLGPYGINVYEVRSGLMATRRQEPVYAQYDAMIREGLTPIRRWGRPEDVARAVGAIADEALAFSTGAVLHVDGGFHLRRL